MRSILDSLQNYERSRIFATAIYQFAESDLQRPRACIGRQQDVEEKEELPRPDGDRQQVRS